MEKVVWIWVGVATLGVVLMVLGVIVAVRSAKRSQVVWVQFGVWAMVLGALCTAAGVIACLVSPGLLAM